MTIKTIDWSYYTGTVPGYGDCRAAVGEYACLLPDRHVESFLGIAGLPGGENVNYLRIPHATGDGRMAGGGQNTDRSLEWQWPNGWVPQGLFYGPNAVIYGAGDAFVQVTSRAEYQATAGWRFVTAAGILFSCESTYADPARGVYEFTDLGDLIIGQGGKPNMGAVVSFPLEPLRRLDPRPVAERTYPFNARFMHSDRDGNNFGVTIVDLGARKTYFVWCSLADLRALPFVTDAPVPPKPEPPKPKPEPPVSTPPNPQSVLSVLQMRRARYPEIVTNDQMVRILNDAGYVFDDMGLHRKDGHGSQPNTGIPCSRQILRYMPLSDPLGWWADVLGATGVGQAIPQAPDWKRSDDGRASFVPCVDTTPIDPGGPGPEPPTGDLEARVSALEADVSALRQALRGWVR